MKTVTAVIIGAGDRGRHVYGKYALEHPEELKIVAVAEPDPQRRKEFQELHGIPDENCFVTYQDLFARPRMADSAFICTQDGMHYEPALMAKQQGYHILLEKPISNTPEECVRIWKDCAKDSHDKLFAVGHVLRYTPFFLQIKKMLDEGAVGRITNIEYAENIGFYHFAHSYVRGHWADSTVSSPLILAKSCHDLDILRWLVGAPVETISASGTLTEFKRENAPENAPERCIDGCPAADTCPYNAVRLYGWFRPNSFLRQIVEMEDSEHNLEHALRHTDYGRCVYHCNNNVPDHLAVRMHFSNEVDVVLTVTAFSSRITRTLRIQGTRGELWADMDRNTIRSVEFATMKSNRLKLDVDREGHFGGDRGLTHSFATRIAQGETTLPTSLLQSLESHLMAFAAEQSRQKNTVVNFPEFVRSYGIDSL